MLVCQDYGQIKKKYTEEDVQIINSTTAVKHILPQNNKNTVDTIIGMVGKTTIRRGTHSYQEGLHKSANPFGWSRNDTAEETDFLRPADISGMKPGEHIVIVQNFANRPMKLKTQFFFEVPDMLRKVRSRGRGPVATKVLPDHVLRRREEENDRLMAEEEIVRASRCGIATTLALWDREGVEALP